MNNILQEKIKQLPQPVYDYLTSLKAADLNVLINEKYDLNWEQIKAFSDLVARLFLKEIPVANLVEEIKQLFGFSDLVARQLACDIAGVRLLVVDEWLGQNIAGLIAAWGGDPARYQKHLAVQQRAVVREAEAEAAAMKEPLDEGPTEEEIDWQERQDKIKELFESQLVPAWRLQDNHLLREVNGEILYLLSGEAGTDFRNDLTNLLLNNREMLSSQRLVLEGKQVDPTVANWLAYWLRQQGSQMFDAVALSDFVATSPNAEPLDDEERQLLVNLLLTYRNLKFFPESMPGDDPKYWQIFPLLSEEEPLAAAPPDGAPPTVARPLTEPQVSQIKPLAVPDNQLAQLQALATQYPAGSLERLAVEEEIAKLRQP